MTVFPSSVLDTQDVRAPWRWILAGLLCLVFAGDLATPLGFAHGVLYVPVILIGGAFLPARPILLLGFAAGVLTSVGWLLSSAPPSGISANVAATNRVVALLAIALTTLTSAWLALTRESLKESERTARTMARLLSMASDVGHLGAWQYDTSKRQAIWSSEIALLHGLPSDEPPSLNDLLSRYAPRDRLRFLEQLETSVHTCTSFEDEYQITGNGQRPLWVRVSGRPHVEVSGRCTVVEGTIQDVSKQKEIEFELANSLNNWKSLAETLPVIIWTANAAQKLTYTSQSLSEYSGATANELLSEGWMKIVHEDDIAVILADWSRSGSNGASFEAVFRIRRKDGTYRWHLARVTRLRLHGDKEETWYGTAMDIDDRIRLENDVKKAAWQYESVIESVTDAIFALDADWRFTLMNHHAEILLDRKKEDLIGKSVWEEFPAAVGTKFQIEYERCMNQAEIVRFEESYEPLGKLFEINAYPSSEGITVYFKDITVQRKINEQLAQAQKLDSLGHLTGGIAHDFNNLLTVIRGNCDLMFEEGPGAPENQLLLQQIREAATSGATMVRRLLAFARKQDLTPAAVDINQLTESMNGLLRRSLGEDIDVSLHLAPDLPMATVDETQLESALLNLAINARDAMPDGGCLTISTSLVNKEVVGFTDSKQTQSSFILIEVTDTGQGMFPETLSKVFDPFYTTKPKGKGTGLGLAMVHGFIKQSSGHVAIASEPGIGTTVRMYLP